MFRLSFIVPCYNVEQYVQHCLDSILSCGLISDEYEILCINDRSSDKTSEIIHRYESSYQQVRVFDLQQRTIFGGVRNIGVREAQGKYVWFVDSDDAIIPDNVKSLLERAENNELDVLAFNFDRFNEDHQLISSSLTFHNSQVTDGISFVKQVLGDMFYVNIGYVWRFLYRLDYLRDKHLTFPEGVAWEDTVYTPKSMIEAERIMSSSLIGYHYYFHQSSVCRIMERKYPGNLIYDYVFNAGADLLAYSKTITDTQLNKGLSSFAIKTYFNNNFVLYMLRTTYNERKSFYRCVNANSDKVSKCIDNIKGIGRMFMLPIFGPLFANVASFLYKITHGIKP